MAGEIALDTSVAIRYLNGDSSVVNRVLALENVVLPLPVVGELLFGAENSSRPLQNLNRYREFINACVVISMNRETAVYYSHRIALRRKGRSIPENDIWIAAQCLEQAWRLVTDDADFNYVDRLMIEKW